MSSRLQGRTALVTSAAQGIGLAIGRAFLASAQGSDLGPHHGTVDRVEAQQSERGEVAAGL